MADNQPESPYTSDPQPVPLVFELRAQDESGMGYTQPTVTLMMNGQPWLKVRAYVDRAQGADGGWYPVVKFRKVEECQ